MPESNPPQSNMDFTQNTIEAAIRLGLLLLLATWCFMIIRPFIEPVMWGVIIAVAIYPLFVKLRSAMGGRNKLAAVVFTLLALALRLVGEELLPLADMISKLTLNPASILGLPGGRIEIGKAADLIVVDPEPHWICQAATFASKGKNTAFEGWDFRGSVTHTIVAGDIVYRL